MISREKAKRKILAALLEEGELTTKQISNKINIHYYRTKILLTELLEENKIIREQKSHYTFWRYNDGV